MAHTERRKSVRFPLPFEQTEAVLRLRGKDVAAVVLNQSAGGFGVRLEAAIDVVPGETVQLGTPSGWTQNRVRSVIHDSDGFRLGLERLADLPHSGEGAPTTSLWSLRRPRPTLPQSNLAVVASAVIIIMGCAMAGLFWHMLPKSTGHHLRVPRPSNHRYSEPVAVETTADPVDAVGEPTAPAAKPPKAGRGSAAKSAGAPASGNWVADQLDGVGRVAQGVGEALPAAASDALASPVAVVKQAAAAAVAPWKKSLAGDGSLVLDLPRFIDRLQISHKQRQQLEQIVKSANDATQRVYQESRQLGTQETMREIDRIRQAASAQAVETLTDDQAQQLQSMVGPPRP